MIKKLAFVAFLTLFSSNLSARDFRTVFHAKITTESEVADSDCNNTKDELVPISDDLKAKGWFCVLMPRKLMDGTYAQAIACQNKNGTMVNAFVHCSSNQVSSDKGSFTLDDTDEKVKGTNFIISCATTAGERI